MKSFLCFSILMVAALVAVLSPATVIATSYDLVILNGRIMDPETQFDGVRNVGIKGGKISKITSKKIKGKQAINANGQVVAPGFLDMHNHNTAAPFGQKLALRDGVTTPMEIEAGVYPVDIWYAFLEGRSQTNYGASVGTIPVRETLLNPGYKTKAYGDFLFDMQLPEATHTSMKWSTQIATAEQIKQIENMLEKGLQQGALGIGHCPGYMVSGSTQRESNIVQKLAGKYGLFSAIHGRFSSQMPPTSGLLGIDELMAPQAAYGGGLVVQHMTAQTLALTPQALQLIDDARAKGIQVLAEIYPYDYGSTIAGADYLHPDNYQKNMGRDYKDIIEVSNLKPLDKKRYEELVKTAPGTSVMFYNATQAIVYQALAHPDTILGSDSYPYTIRKTNGPVIAWDTPYDSVNGHPRGAGTHARLLRLVREKKVDIPLMLAVSKMTYQIARFMQDNGVEQMAHKGRIQVGADADITIFDPKTVTDNSTMKDGGLPSTGIPYVVVNGTIVVKDSKVIKGVYPGKAIRRSVLQ
ncbi:MAG: amidohydrolase family protein [Gammaproteobacteria bacterium]